MSQHIAQDAQAGRLANHSCGTCKQGRRIPWWCRDKAPLNGHEAAQEYTRGLMPAVRAKLLDRSLCATNSCTRMATCRGRGRGT